MILNDREQKLCESPEIFMEKNRDITYLVTNLNNTNKDFSS